MVGEILLDPLWINGERNLTRHVLRRSEARGTGGGPPPRPHEDE